MSKQKKGYEVDSGDIAELEDALIEVDVGYVDPEDAEGKCFAFESLGEITWLYIFVTISLRSQGGLFIYKEDLDGKKCAGFYQTMVVLLIFVLPTMLMQIVIGNISGRSCVIISQLAPIADGLQYSMVILTLFELMKVVSYSRMALTYTLYSFSTPWLFCKGLKGCIGKPEITSGPKVNSSIYVYKQLSSEFFYTENLMNLRSDLEPTLYFILEATLLIYIFLVIFFLGQVDIRQHAKNIKLCSKFYLTGVFILFAAVYMNESDLPNQNWVFMFLPEIEDVFALISPTAWGITVKQISVKFLLGLPYNILIGASLGKYANLEYVTVHLWAISILVRLFVTLGVLFISTALAVKLGVDLYDLHAPVDRFWWSLIPMEIGLATTGASVLSATYFGFITTTSILLIMCHTSIIIATCSDIKPSLKHYRKYLALGLALFMSLLSSSLDFTGMLNDFVLFIIENVTATGGLIVVFIQALAALWIHRADNLADDFHFKFGYQPTLFWKVFWWILPATAMVFIVCLTDYLTACMTREQFILSLSMFIALFLLHAIVLSIRIFKSVQKHDLRSLLRKTEEWGSPDENERIDRDLYPPREECKYNRRFDVCRHRCIRYSPVLPQVVAKEKEMRVQTLNKKRKTTNPVNPRPKLSDVSSDSDA